MGMLEIGGGSGEGSIILCGEDAQNACPQCCDEEGNCTFGNFDSDTACKPNGGLDCDKICPNSASSSSNTVVEPVSSMEDTNETDKSSGESITFGGSSIMICGENLAQACSECCDEKGNCNFGNIDSDTACKPNGGPDCSKICSSSPSINLDETTTEVETDATSKPTPTPERTNTSLDETTTEAETDATSKPTSTPELTASPMTDAGNKDSEDGNSTQSDESKAEMPSISKATKLITLSLGIFGIMGLLQ